MVSFDDLLGALQQGSGFAYQYAARLHALRQLLVTVLRIPVVSLEARVRAVSSVAGTAGQTFQLLLQGADARAHAASIRPVLPSFFSRIAPSMMLSLPTSGGAGSHCIAT